MKLRKLGQQGPTVSAIGMGCCPLSGVYGSRDDSEGIATIRRAVELGVTLFDTSDMYGQGHNERLLGRALEGLRDKVLIATKFGGVLADTDEENHEGLPRTNGFNGRPEYVRSACEASLRRLGVDTIDLYQVHRVDPATPIEETVGALSELIRQGKVRYYGLSEANVSDMRRAHSVHPLTSLQSEYSLFERGVEKEILACCDELGVGFVPFTPLGRGALAGSLTPDTKLQANDIRMSGLFPRASGEHLRNNAPLVEVVREVAQRHNASLAQVALAWLLSRRPYVVPIPGSDRITYLEENVGAPELELTAADLEALDAIGDRVDGPRYASTVPQAATHSSRPLQPQ